MPTCQMGQQQFSMPLRHLNLDFSFRTVLEKNHPEVSFANKTQIVAKRNNRPNIIFKKIHNNLYLYHVELDIMA